ncbi:FAR-17a/AIG1-like protein [Kockovaella imperatae]|uniref:FAR-17a/AIG1-like protein n=1 Tax=Kockovaella imperatae TaxID=4999 RepID=A0A1Y1UQB7_9TREE|nr:FAR-17a/AIG1-like protein [Kockovaella imperatae]ORX39694.1 FAR-17a/AIG1-like protein [Kockovaella imperatae]
MSKANGGPKMTPISKDDSRDEVKGSKKSYDASRPRRHLGHFLFHSCTAGQMLNGFLGLNAIARDNKVEAQYGGFLQYLTIVGLFISITAMLLSSMKDLVPSLRKLHRIKRGLLLFALPVEIVIASIYWPLAIFAPSLMFPKSPEDVSSPVPSSVPATDLLFKIPLNMDLSMHALPAFALLFDFFFLEKKYTPPASTIGAPLLALTFGTLYGVWVEHCATINGKFPYPFLNVMDFIPRVILYITATFGSLFAFWGLNGLHE